MHLDSVERALADFVGAEEPRVLALVGAWGTGKTFYWNEFLANQSPKKHQAQAYAYVSLFGLKDLGDVQDAIVAGGRPIGDVSPPEQESVKERGILDRFRRTVRNSGAIAERTVRSYADVLEKVPRLGELGHLARAVAFRFVRNYLVCIDDVERRSDSLPLRDVLGLANVLREQRGCRVLVILNSDGFSEADRDQFHAFREKVFDSEIQFAPSAADCVSVVFSGRSALYERAAQLAVRLDITNIRVLFRIRRLIDAVASLAVVKDDEVQTQIVHSAVLLGWCFNSHDGKAPSFSYVKQVSLVSFMNLDRNEARAGDEIEWNRLLSDYGYMNTDELDLSICEVLERGYVDTTRLATSVSNRADAARRARLLRAFEDAWGLFHGSFDPSPDALAKAFEASVTAGAEVISSVNMSGTAMLLRSLGFDVLADDLVTHWIEVQQRMRPAVLNIEASDWKAEIRDVRFRERAQAAFDRLPRTARSFRDTAITVTKERGWSEDDVSVLRSATVDDYYRLFKSLSYPLTGAVIRRLLGFRELATSSADYGRIAESAHEALVRIGRESALNRRRVKNYGIEVAAVELENSEEGQG